MDNNFKVVSVSPNLIQIEIIDINEFKINQENEKLSIGSYLKITDDKHKSIIAIVKAYKIRDIVDKDVKEYEEENIDYPFREPIFIVDAQPIGFINERGKFCRGGQQLTIPPNDVLIANRKILESIFSDIDEEKRFNFSVLSKDDRVKAVVDGDKFFSKHLAVLGSTGSGKSCTVAKILQNGINKSEDQVKRGLLNNSHVLVFDLHGEYESAFPRPNYNSNLLNIENLILPYWLMNSEELQEFFIDTEANDHNQRNVFKEAVVKNKQKYNKHIDKKYITFDSPIPFDIYEVLQYIKNRNIEKAEDGEICWVRESEKRNLNQHADDLFENDIKFQGKTTGTLNGKFINFISRFENKLSDERLQFLFNENVKNVLLDDVLKQFIGYADEMANINIIDLSGIPFEVLSIVVSLINRLIFDFCYYYKKTKNGKEVPILIVLEEAHNYIPKGQGMKYNSVKKSIERIAKEGRKYGLSLMIVSQRPSEISETIMSQCNNFVVMRLTNPTDQQYVARLLPDSTSIVTDNLPNLEQREALIIGEAIPMPSLTKIDEVTDKPDSRDIDFYTEWKKNWVYLNFNDILFNMTKTDKKIGCCGKVCIQCNTYEAIHKDDVKISSTYEFQSSEENGRCHGCKSEMIFGINKGCKIRSCCLDKEIISCADCNEENCNVLNEYHKIDTISYKNIKEIREFNNCK